MSVSKPDKTHNTSRYFYLGLNHFSKQSIKNLLQTQWNNLTFLNLCNSFFEIDECGLEEEENVKLLIKCEWKILKGLSLCLNPICNCFIDYLYRANWPLLNEVNLCKNFTI